MQKQFATTLTLMISGPELIIHSCDNNHLIGTNPGSNIINSDPQLTCHNSDRDNIRHVVLLTRPVRFQRVVYRICGLQLQLDSSVRTNSQISQCCWIRHALAFKRPFFLNDDTLTKWFPFFLFDPNVNNMFLRLN